MKPYLILTAAYVLVHFWLVLNQSFFWDDWIWIQNPNELRIALDELGFVFLKPFLVNLHKWPIPYIKVFIFTCYLASGLLFYQSIRNLRIFDRSTSLMCGVLFMILPYNIIGRSTVCTASYGISLVFFMIGFLCYVDFRKKPSLLSFLAAALTFTISFNTTSILVFYITSVTLTEFSFFKSYKKTLRNLTLVLLLTFVHALIFYLIKVRYFPAHGIYSNYNQVTFETHTLLKMFLNIGTYIFDPLAFAALGKNLTRDETFNRKIFYTCILYFPIIWALLKRNYRAALIAFSAISLCIAAFLPYQVVGKLPATYSWDSRHQLLFSSGTSLWIASVFNLLLPYKKIISVIFAFTLIVTSIATARMYLSVQGLRYHELSLQQQFEKNLPAQSQRSYMIADRGQPPGVMEQSWSFYELTGMLYNVLGTQNNFIIMTSDVSTMNLTNMPHSFGNYKERYMVANARWNKPFYCIKITDLTRMNELASLYLLTKEYTESARDFQARIREIYRMSVTPAQLDSNGNPICSP